MTAQTTIRFTTALVAKQMADVQHQLSSFTNNPPFVFTLNSLSAPKMATKMYVSPKLTSKPPFSLLLKCQFPPAHRVLTIS